MLKNVLKRINLNTEKEVILKILNHIFNNQKIILKYENDFNSEYLSELINKSRITLPVYNLLENEQINKILDKYVKYKKINNISLFKELIKIKKIFEINNIEYACFKGPAISQIAYNNVNNREYTDLDIFINKNDFQAVKYLLIKDGYESLFKLNDFLELKFIKNYHYYNLFNPSTNTNIDLHFSTERRNLSFNFSFDDLSNHLVDIEVDGSQIKTFDQETTVILLILHGSKHGWTKLLWILDIALILKNQEINWDYILGIAREKNFLNMLLCYCKISEIIFCMSFPLEIDNLIKNNNNIKNLALDTIYKSFESENLYNNYYYYRSMDKYSDRILKFMNNLRPTPIEFSYQLPKQLYILYYFLRILRLTYKLSGKMLNS